MSKMNNNKRDEVLGRMLELHDEERHRVLENTPDIMIIPGQEVFVEALVNGVNARVKTRLTGGLKGEYLIIGTPRVNGQIVPLRDGRDIVIRYIQEGAVFGFASKIMRTIGQPFNLAIVSYPTAIEEVSLRRSPRIPVVIPVERDEVQRQGELIINLSDGGCALQLNQMVDMGEVFLLSFTLPNGVFIKNIVSKVMRIEASAGKVVCGVCFEDKSSSGKKAVAEYIKLVQLSVHQPK